MFNKTIIDVCFFKSREFIYLFYLLTRVSEKVTVSLCSNVPPLNKSKSLECYHSPPPSEREKGEKKNQQKRILPSTPVDRHPQSYLRYQ